MLSLFPGLGTSTAVAGPNMALGSSGSGKDEAKQVPFRVARAKGPKGTRVGGKKGKSKGKSKRMASGALKLGSSEEVARVFNSVGDPLTWQWPVKQFNGIYRTTTSSYISAAFTSSASIEVDFAKAFTINLINGSELAAYQALFDQVQLERIEVLLVPQSVTLGNSSSNQGMLVSAVDYDSSSASTISNLMTYTNSLMASGAVARYHTWTPSVALLAGTTGGTTGIDAVMVSKPWLDSINGVTTPQYGFKASISVTDAAYKYDLYYRMHLNWRQKI